MPFNAFKITATMQTFTTAFIHKLQHLHQNNSAVHFFPEGHTSAKIWQLQQHRSICTETESKKLELKSPP